MYLLKDILKKFLREVVPKSMVEVLVRNNLEYAHISYAQEGEDLLLDTLLNFPSRGFYVDVGAHHPRRFSNTFIFYKRGWQGINIDPAPNGMTLFARERPRDINLEIAVASAPEPQALFVFEEGALSTLSPSKAEEYRRAGHPTIAIHNVTARPLKDILEEFLPAEKNIDFITIDAEGFDLDVLKSNDWHKYRSIIVAVEDHFLIEKFVLTSDIITFMEQNDYRLVAKTRLTLFFKDNRETNNYA